MIRTVFGRNIRKAVIKALDKQELVLPDDMSLRQVKNLLNKIGHNKWNVRICEKYSHADAVMVRSYGLYYSNKKDNLVKCRELLGQGSIEEP